MTAAAMVMSLLVFGLEPAIQLTRATDVRRQLGSGALGLSKASRHKVLLRWQVAVSAAFFLLASMTVRYLFVELRHDSGVQLEGLAVAQLNVSAQGWDVTRSRAALERVVQEARARGDFDRAAVSTGMPFGTFSPTVRASTPDKPITQSSAAPLNARLVAGTPGIFRTIGVPIVRGRAFDDRDRGGSSVAVLSEAAALRLFGTTDVVGREMLTQVTSRGERPVTTRTVIGIARDADDWYLSDRRGQVVYMPFEESFEFPVTVVARSGQRDVPAVGALEAAIRRADPDLAIVQTGPARSVLTGPYAFLRFASMASLTLGFLTLALAMVGLYGVQSQGVAQRTSEIGVRMSLGATAGQINRMILKDGYRPVIDGMAIGLMFGLGGRAVIRAYLDVKMSILDPWMLAFVPVPLILAGFCACYLPARRAAKVDPQIALRRL